MRILIAALTLISASIAVANDFNSEKLKLQPFELQWMNNEDSSAFFRSDDYPTSIWVLEAYFKNCPYCNDNAPLVDRLREHYADRADIQIVDVGRDCRDSDYTTWIARHEPNHPVLRDCDMEVLGQLGTQGYPSTYLLDCNLELSKKYVGAWSNSTYQDIIRKIDALSEVGCEKK